MLKIYILILFFCSALLGSSSDEIIFEIVFIRHGARSSRESINITDVNWDEGNDALTGSGQRQLYILGRMMNKYFVKDLKFLSEKYNPAEIKVQSSSSSRTLMSAQSFLLGLYPYDGLELTMNELNNNKTWIPPNNLTVNKTYYEKLNTSAVPYKIPIIPIIDYQKMFDRMLSFSFCDKFYEYRMAYYIVKHLKTYTKNIIRVFKRHVL